MTAASHPLRRTWLIVASLLALSGCANTPFYIEARDKQGQALVQATKDVDLTAVVASIDKKFATLRQMEADTARARLTTNRNLEIARVASPGGDGKASLKDRYVQPLLERRIERLAGQPLTAAQLDGILVAVATDETTERLAAGALRAFNSMSGLNLDSCNAASRIANDRGEIDAKVLARITARQSSVALLFKNVMAQCERSVDAITLLVKEGGQLQELAERRNAAEGQVKAYEGLLEKQQELLAERLKDYDKAVADLKLTPADSGALAQLTQAADRLKADLERLRTAAEKAGKLDIFDHAEALARLDALEAVLDAVSSGTSDPALLSPAQQRGVALVRLIPTVADEADKLLKNAQRPRLGPLLLAKEQQQLAVASFAGKLALLKRLTGLRQQALEAARQELLALARARRALGPPAQGQGVTVDLAQTVDVVMGDATQDGRKRAALFESFAYYFDHAQMYRSQQALLELESNGVADEVVMQQSRSAALMWQSLLSNMAAILADYHAAGIKTADLAEFLKGLGIFYVGSQTGK